VKECASKGGREGKKTCKKMCAKESVKPAIGERRENPHFLANESRFSLTFPFFSLSASETNLNSPYGA
jgi:hypothetical protein